jgi:hypothetical protein
MTFRPLTADKKVDLGQLAAPADRSLSDLLPPAPAEPAVGSDAITPRLRSSTRAQLAGWVVVGLTLLVAGVYITQSLPISVQRVSSTQRGPSAVPTSLQPPTVAAVAQEPAPQAPQRTLERPVGAFAAPDGIYLGIIEAGRPYTPTARLGDAWTQIVAAGSGRVWIKAAELAPDASLIDLATPTARPLPTAPPAPQVIVREMPAAPQPTQCASFSGGGTSVQRCGTAPIEQLEADARAAWHAQFGGNVAPIATMTPYGAKP